MTLPFDVARCTGIHEDGEWRDGCEKCTRRTSPPGPQTPWITPPQIIVFECEFLIEEQA